MSTFDDYPPRKIEAFRAPARRLAGLRALWQEVARFPPSNHDIRPPRQPARSIYCHKYFWYAMLDLLRNKRSDRPVFASASRNAAPYQLKLQEILPDAP
jgi:hypothetical protein